MEQNWKQKQAGEDLRNEIVDAIEKFHREHNFSPTRAELGELLGRSDVIIGKHVKILVEEGRLTEGKGPRTLAVPI